MITIKFADGSSKSYKANRIKLKGEMIILKRWFFTIGIVSASLVKSAIKLEERKVKQLDFGKVGF